MFGKWIGEHGTFKGLLRGTWNSSAEVTDASDPFAGSFHGVWADRTLKVRGKYGGKWAAGPRTRDGGGNSDGSGRDDRIGEIPNNARGFFHGRWAKNSAD
jgi:hypothetical protein